MNRNSREVLGTTELAAVELDDISNTAPHVIETSA